MIVSDDKQLYYVVHTGNKRLYFPREYDREKITRLYRSLRIEQDRRSPHHYVDSLSEWTGKSLSTLS